MSPNFPSPYGQNQHCQISATQGYLVIKAFKTEEFDRLTVNGKPYSGELEFSEELATLNGVPVTGVITWDSDETLGKEGWKLCLESR